MKIFRSMSAAFIALSLLMARVSAALYEEGAPGYIIHLTIRETWTDGYYTEYGYIYWDLYENDWVEGDDGCGYTYMSGVWYGSYCGWLTYDVVASDWEYIGSGNVTGDMAVSTEYAAPEAGTDRTDLGIGEWVTISLPGYNASWSMSGSGSLEAVFGTLSNTSTVRYIAPDDDGSADLYAIAAAGTGSVSFNVAKPIGNNVTVYDNTPSNVGTVTATNPQSVGQSSRFGMQLVPTTVSYARSRIQEDIPSVSHTFPDSSVINPIATPGVCCQGTPDSNNQFMDVTQTNRKNINRLKIGGTVNATSWFLLIKVQIQGPSGWLDAYTNTHSRSFDSSAQGTANIGGISASSQGPFAESGF